MTEPVTAPAPIIAVEHLTKTVADATGSLDILRDIDFRLYPKETAAIVGASGSGKSTLLSIVAGLDTPSQGTVRLAGDDIFAMGEDSRKAISTELKAIYAGLLDLANSTDGAGRYLFGGTSDGSAPFAIAGGSVIYSGDQTQRQVEVAPDMFVADTLPGSEVFLRLRTGDGRIDGQAAAGNTGTGLLMGFGVTDSTAWDGGTYTLSFGAGDTYQVTDAGGTVVTTGTYAKGESIAFAGVQMRIEGQPANGDSFTLGPAGSRDIFATVQGLITTLDTNPTTYAQRAAMQNDLQAAMRDVATAQSKMIDARASGGAQLSAIDDAAALREANNVTLQGTLSTLRDLDWAEAIGRYQMENTALQAAQTVFMQMQSLSLFKLMG